MTLRMAFLVPAAGALLLSSVDAHAQTDRLWTAGLKGGIGQGGFTGSTEFNWNQTNLSTALYLNRGVREWFAFQPELAHLRKVGISRVGGSQLTLSVDYLELPLLAQFKLPTPAITPFVLAGPNVALSLACTLKFAGGGLSTTDNCDTGNGTVRTRRFDFGGTVGAGIQWPIGIATMVVEGRASAGLRSLVAPVDANNTRSFGWSVMAGFGMPLEQGGRRRIPRTIPSRTLEPLPPPMPPRILAQPEPTAPAIADRAGKRISVNAVDTDVRALLLAIAKEGDLNIVVSSDVRARVSLHLLDVPAMEAVQAIVATAGLSLAQPPTRTWPAVVFYQLPINVNQASRETIAARFGVSPEMARWLVESRAGIKP